ncbi:tRNA uridine-5-carboxymethylaminomethyl(34) synthesis GTPase MnmE [Sulfurihydrogenibium azorense]|uniref:tRNA uridine-5-carboxymethylaminomethyl(34) synthesis GTPase MnmE n=1 Tax=Sulfurihydrogenibium azorense TaxID=309806 RepID=UPI00240A3EFF|nr:tRNA uridine-5-carboxymethylaminomethyl(34) synthesis GTPase MnmE [Sulfurihydrogenibium azorense]MDM7273042.1 tRNA uridine-5-carboxymethylaminomethyl(34) synthesis GTPase MnmE [Sulfurihydrogenibium azorense]
MKKDTIVANATPLIPSAVGIVRISGEDALKIGKQIFTLPQEIQERKAYFGKILDLDGSVLDEGLFIYFKAPKSFTGEDVVEIYPHGSVPVIKKIIENVITLGGRLANPGEFTYRAFLNGKIDLTQAEAIADLISAKTEKASKAAVRLLEGKLSEKINSLRETLLNLISLIEAEINFPEDVEEIDSQLIVENLLKVKKSIDKLVESYKKGSLIKEGIKLAIVGRPNVGKSSLFNAMVGYERSIVSSYQGTTRDFIEETLKIKDIPIILLDTAGIRETAEYVEKLGIERSKQKIEEADIILFVIDGSQGFTDEDKKIYDEIKNKIHIIVINKADLITKPLDIFEKSDNIIYTSSVTFQGIKDLEEKIIEILGITETEDEIIINLRHYTLLKQAIEKIEKVIENIDFLIENKEILMLDLQEVLNYLEEIVGYITTEDVLGNIFSKFCIGK